MKLFPTSIMALKESKWLAVASVIMGGLITTFSHKRISSVSTELVGIRFYRIASCIWFMGVWYEHGFPKINSSIFQIEWINT